MCQGAFLRTIEQRQYFFGIFLERLSLANNAIKDLSAPNLSKLQRLEQLLDGGRGRTNLVPGVRELGQVAHLHLAERASAFPLHEPRPDGAVEHEQAEGLPATDHRVDLDDEPDLGERDHAEEQQQEPEHGIELRGRADR